MKLKNLLFVFCLALLAGCQKDPDTESAPARDTDRVEGVIRMKLDRETAEALNVTRTRSGRVLTGNKSFGMGIGVEYVLMQMIAVRGGYHVADSHGYDYGTIGAGLRFMHLELDFSYLFAAKKCPWRNTYQVGVGLYF